LGNKSKADADFVKIGADTAPSELGKVTVYGPGAGGIPATVKVPVIWKVVAEMLQETPGPSRPGGVLYSVPAQPTPASAALKPEPVMETDVKDSPLVGVSVIFGTTAKLPVPKPPPAPKTCTAQVPPCAVVLTVKEAVRAPAVIVHVGEGTPEKRFDPAGATIVHAPLSAEVKVPVTLTGPVPVKPEEGEIVSVTGTPFVKVAVALSTCPGSPTLIV